jgi:hypothetical protein
MKRLRYWSAFGWLCWWSGWGVSSSLCVFVHDMAWWKGLIALTGGIACGWLARKCAREALRQTRETLAEVLEEFDLMDPVRGRWCAPALVRDETMQRWREVAGLKDEEPTDAP